MSANPTKPSTRPSTSSEKWQPRLARSARLLCLLVPLVAVHVAAPGCKMEVEAGPSEPPKRPASVPEAAVWVGGPNGGNFLFVRPAGVFRPNLYTVEVYDPGSGTRVHRGVLRLEPPRSGQFPVGEATSYSLWDGKTLHLKDGRRLVAPAPGE
jgi:hypothetical protein